jgi:hypothetical protein
MHSRLYKDAGDSGNDNIDSGQQIKVLAVAEALLAVSIDQIISYGELTRVAGCDIQGTNNRWIVTHAREHCTKTRGVMFANERHVGYRRLSSESGVKFAGERGIRRTRSAAHTANRRLQNAVARANDLSPAEQKLANQRMAVFGMVEYLTKARTVNTMPDEEPEQTDGLKGVKDALGL